jgi:hypothetical protein
MASSNSYNFTVTRDDIIKTALLHIGVIGEGETPSANQVTEAALMLNMIVKLRAADGMPAWSLKRGYLLPNNDISSMATTSHVVTYYDGTYVYIDAASGATTVTVAAIGTIANGDVIGIELDDGDMHWTTVNGAPSDTLVTLTAALPSAASDGNRVYAYTSSTDLIQRPLRIIDAELLNTVSETTIPIEILSREDYFALNNRNTEGVVNGIYYEAGLGSGTADPTSSSTWYGTFYFYPRFQDGNHLIQFTYHRPFQDFDAATDNPDFPQEFYLPLTLELASLLGPRYGVDIDERRSLAQEAKFYREEALATVSPEGSLFIQPDTSRMR